mgnify:CR=1 FL=1
MNVDKTSIYYLILGATFLMNFAFVPLLFEVLQQRNTTNIPYITLLCFILAQALFLFIVVYRNYYFHTFIYLVGFICVSALLFLKKFYDTKNIHVIRTHVSQE